MKRKVFAVICLILIALDIIGLIYSALFAEDKRVMLVFLFFLIVVPAVIYAIRYFFP